MQDDKIKDLLSGTKIKAGENLKFRIMQQIETENALSRKKVTNTRPILGNMLTIFGVMYLLIAIVAIFIYSSSGKGALETTTFMIPAILIASVCGMFLTISVYDDRRRSKHKTR